MFNYAAISHFCDRVILHWVNLLWQKAKTTCQEGLHAGAVGQFHRRVTRVRGQGGVSSVVEQQPDYRQIITCYCIMKGPEKNIEKQKKIGYDLKRNSASSV